MIYDICGLFKVVSQNIIRQTASYVAFYQFLGGVWLFGEPLGNHYFGWGPIMWKPMDHHVKNQHDRRPPGELNVLLVQGW